MRPDDNIMKEITQIVKILFDKYGCRNPFYIAKRMGIEYSFPDFKDNMWAFSEKRNNEDLGRIYVSKNLGPYSQKLLTGHELGHMLMHDSGNNLFDKGIDPQKEFEANYFMFQLIPQFAEWFTYDFDSIEFFNEYITTRIMLIIESERKELQSNTIDASIVSARNETLLTLYPDGKKLIRFDYLTGETEELVSFSK